MTPCSSRFVVQRLYWLHSSSVFSQFLQCFTASVAYWVFSRFLGAREPYSYSARSNLIFLFPFTVTVGPISLGISRVPVGFRPFPFPLTPLFVTVLFIRCGTMRYENALFCARQAYSRWMTTHAVAARCAGVINRVEFHVANVCLSL